MKVDIESTFARLEYSLSSYEASSKEDTTMVNGNLALKNEIPHLVIGKQSMNISKIARIISTKQIMIDNETPKIKISVKDNVYNCIDLWPDPHIKLSQQISPYDMAIMDAAYSIMNAGCNVLTAEWIAVVLSGNKSQKVTPQKVSAIRKSLDKLRSIHIRIDATEEINARSKSKNKADKYIYESYLLPLDKVEAKYTAIVIKRYVIKRCLLIKSNNKLHSNKISFQWKDPDGGENSYNTPMKNNDTHIVWPEPLQENKYHTLFLLNKKHLHSRNQYLMLFYKCPWNSIDTQRIII